MSSSGYGQFVLSDISELTTSFLSKMVEIQKLRVKNDRYLYEKYVADREEYSTVLGVCKDSRKCIDGISYKKYDPECYPLKEQYSNEDIQGTVRLLYSDTKKDQTSLWHDFRKKSESLLSVIKSPFLYVEFIVDKDKNVPSEEGGVTDKQPLFFINEISYRPDDAGFISRISHKLSQFELFMDSLEAQLKANGIPKSDTLLPIEPLDEYCCFTLIPLREILFILNELNHEHGAGQTQMKFRLYEKTLPKVEGEIPLPSRRIIGYLMHHSSQDGIEILKTRLKNLDLSTDTVVTLLEALELTKKQIDTNRKGLSGVGI